MLFGHDILKLLTYNTTTTHLWICILFENKAMWRKCIGCVQTSGVNKKTRNVADCVLACVWSSMFSNKIWMINRIEERHVKIHITTNLLIKPCRKLRFYFWLYKNQINTKFLLKMGWQKSETKLQCSWNKYPVGEATLRIRVATDFVWRHTQCGEQVMSKPRHNLMQFHSLKMLKLVTAIAHYFAWKTMSALFKCGHFAFGRKMNWLS